MATPNLAATTPNPMAVYPFAATRCLRSVGPVSRVVVVVGGFAQEWVISRITSPPARTSCRSNLENHILVFLCHSHARSGPKTGPKTLAPLRRQQHTTQINGYLGHIFHTPDRCFSRMCHSRTVSLHLPPHLHYHSRSD